MFIVKAKTKFILFLFCSWTWALTFMKVMKYSSENFFNIPVLSGLICLTFDNFVTITKKIQQ